VIWTLTWLTCYRPILTYGGQGVNKKGVLAGHHAIIYSSKKPVAFRGEREKGLTMHSIRVVPNNPRHKLDEASRLNYAKQYTVEYNVKSWFIGKVHADSEWQLRTDYNRVHTPLEVTGAKPPGDLMINLVYETAANYSISDESNSQQTRNTSTDNVDEGLGVLSMNSRREADRETQTAEMGDKVSGRLNSRDQHYDLQNASETEPNQVNTILGKTPDKNLSEAPNLEHFTSHQPLYSHAWPVEDGFSRYSSSPGSSSVGSDIPSRGSSTTSLFSDQPDIHEHLVIVIRQDAKLQAVCDQAIHKPTWDRFEKNLKRCLVQLSKDIRIEVESRQATQASRAIRTFARRAAQSIKETLEDQELTKERNQQEMEMYRLASQVDPNAEGTVDLQDLTNETTQFQRTGQADPNSDGSDVDEMGPIDDLEDDMTEFKEFKDLVVSSNSFERFKERLDLYVNPDQARLAVFQQWPNLSPKSSRQSLSYDVEWDLEPFIDNRVKEYTQVGNLVTLTGEALNAEALSSREYLSRAWPDIGTLLLEGVELLLLHKSSCKTPCKSS
jgi:hypothetical protein